jgi:hypothetical protein
MSLEMDMLLPMRFELACVLRQTLNGCHRMTTNPQSRKKAAVDRLAVKPDSASAAIARVASFFHSKPSQLAKKCSQALLTSVRQAGDDCEALCPSQQWL